MMIEPYVSRKPPRLSVVPVQVSRSGMSEPRIVSLLETTG